MAYVCLLFCSETLLSGSVYTVYSLRKYDVKKIKSIAKKNKKPFFDIFLLVLTSVFTSKPYFFVLVVHFIIRTLPPDHFSDKHFGISLRKWSRKTT